jgi:hypothetical protein
MAVRRRHERKGPTGDRTVEPRAGERVGESPRSTVGFVTTEPAFLSKPECEPSGTPSEAEVC